MYGRHVVGGPDWPGWHRQESGQGQGSLALHSRSEAMVAVLVALLALASTAMAQLPTTMRMVKATGRCNAPFTCMGVVTVPLPIPKHGQALVVSTPPHPQLDFPGLCLTGCLRLPCAGGDDQLRQPF